MLNNFIRWSMRPIKPAAANNHKPYLVRKLESKSKGLENHLAIPRDTVGGAVTSISFEAVTELPALSMAFTWTVFVPEVKVTDWLCWSADTTFGSPPPTFISYRSIPEASSMLENVRSRLSTVGATSATLTSNA